MTKKELIEYLKSIKPRFQKKGIEEIALFGSIAKEDSNIYSDIDIAIKTNKDFIDRFGAYEYFNVIDEIKYTLTKKFGKNVDILDLDSNSPFLKDIKKDLIYV